MTTLDERKKNRWLMLWKFYELANGRADDEIIDMWQVGAEFGWDHETTETTYDYLQGEGLLKAMTLGGGATITHKGVKEVQKAEEQPQEPTLYFPAFIINIPLPSEKRRENSETEEERGSTTPAFSAGSPGISIKSLPSSTTGGKIDRLIASGRFSEEEEKEIEAVLIEVTRRFISFKEIQRKMQEEG